MKSVNGKSSVLLLCVVKSQLSTERHKKRAPSGMGRAYGDRKGKSIRMEYKQTFFKTNTGALRILEAAE